MQNYYSTQTRRAGTYVVKTGSGKIVSAPLTKAAALKLKAVMNAEQSANQTYLGK